MACDMTCAHGSIAYYTHSAYQTVLYFKLLYAMLTHHRCHTHILKSNKKIARKKAPFECELCFDARFTRARITVCVNAGERTFCRFYVCV